MTVLLSPVDGYRLASINSSLGITAILIHILISLKICSGDMMHKDISQKLADSGVGEEAQF